MFGLHSEQTRKTLLEEDGITLTRAVEITQAKESAIRDAKALQGAKNATATVLQMSSSVQANHTGRPKLCFRCGRSDHDSPACRFRQAECHKCGKIGHIAPACRSQKSQSGNYAPRTNYFESSQPQSSSFEDQQEMGTFVCSASKGSSRPIQVSISINGKPLVMQLDTGTAVSLMAESTFQKFFSETQLTQSNLVLKTYTGELMGVVGAVSVEVQYGEQPPKQLDTIVVRGNGPCLLGRNWMHHIPLDWKQIGSVSCEESNKTVDQLLARYEDVFDEGLGTIRPFTVKLSVRSDATPKFCKARPVPYALREAVDEQLDNLEAMRILEKKLIIASGQHR